MTPTEDGDGVENENENGDEDEEEDEEQGPESARTPTKRRTYSSGVDRGVDLQAGPSSASTSASASRRSARRPGDTSAFFALRPGSGHSGSGITPPNHRGRGRDRSISPTPEKRGVLAPRRNLQEVRERRVLGKRRDWRYPEVVWSGRGMRQENEKYLDQVRDDWPCHYSASLTWGDTQLWSDLPAFLERHALPSTSTSQATSTATQQA
jgi:hypothetical protein